MTARLKQECPSCGQSLRIKESQLAQMIRCTKCRYVFEPGNAQASSEASTDSLPEAVSVETVVNARLETQAEGSREASASRAEQPLRKLGRFQLERVLGQGEFGRVYLAFDPQLERRVALKVLTGGANNQTRIQRFMTEAKAAARLKHPHIVPTFESGKEENRYYIASEFVEGTLLSDEAARKAFDERAAAECIRKLATALAYAHESKVIHRDVKPQNILIDSVGEPHLMDFGLARRVDEESSLTIDGAMLGTPAYMSPEQARGEFQKVGSTSDQYSLAVVLYQLLTGRTPFEGLPHLVVVKVAQGDVPPVKTVAAGVSADLSAICEKAMQKLPGDRYASCKEFGDDLAAWQNGSPVAARPLNTLQKAVRFVAGHRAIVAMTTVTLGLSLLLSIVVWHAFNDAPPSNLAAEQSSGQKDPAKVPLPPRDDPKNHNSEIDAGAKIVAPVVVEPVVVESTVVNTEVAEGNLNNVMGSDSDSAPPVNNQQASDTPTDSEQSAKPGTTVASMDIGFAALLDESDEWVWGPPEPVTWLDNSVNLYSLPAISMDGLTLAVVSEKAGGSGNADIWITRRKNLSDNWKPLLSPAFEINSPKCDSFPCLSADGGTLYFHTHRPVEERGNIWITKWHSGEARWELTAPLPGSVNSSGDERESVVSPNGLELIVWSTESQSQSEGQLWQYRRRDISEPFADGLPLREANSALTNIRLDYALFYSPDSLMVVFATFDKPGQFLLCSRTTIDSQWENPRLIHTLPVDARGVTYSPAARLILAYRNESETVWQMQLEPRATPASATGEPTTPVSPSFSEVTVETDASTTSTSGEVDLLRLVDPGECAVYGTWERVEGGIRSPGTVGQRLQIPFLPDNEYDISAVVTPLDALSGKVTDGLTIGLVSQGHPFHVILNFANLAALEQVDGLDVGHRPGPGRNQSSVPCTDIMKQNQAAEIVCRVRKSGVTVDVDGTTLIEWKGKPEQLSRNGYWRMPVDQTLFIGGFGRYEFSKLVFKRVNGSGRNLPPYRLNSANSLQLAADALHVPVELVNDISKVWYLLLNDRMDGELALQVTPRLSMIKPEDIRLLASLTCPVHLTLSRLDWGSWSDDTTLLLTQMPKLKSLQIDDKGAMPEVLPKVLSQSKSLRHLTLGHQKLDETQAREIGKITSLRELGFNFTDMDDASVQILAEALPELELFHIGYTGADSRLTNAAIKSLSQLAKLRDLSIRENPTINDQCVDDLLKLKNLSVLWIDGTGITKSGYDRLKSQMPNTAITWAP